jgi:small subunit ribosomal protein S20
MYPFCELANIKSQIKRIRQNEKRRLRNKAVRSELKTRIKKAIAAASRGEADEALALARVAQKRLDMAASKGIIHRNQAANRKSKLARRINALLASAGASIQEG